MPLGDWPIRARRVGALQARCDAGLGSFVTARVTESMSNYMLDTAERELVDFSIVHRALAGARSRRISTARISAR